MDGSLTEAVNEHPSASGDLKDPRPDAAQKRLRECSDQKDACEAIREIVSNLLGCEEMALVQFDRASGGFSLIWSFGIEPKAFHLPAVFQGSGLPRVVAGEPYIEEAPGEPNLGGQGIKASAFVPIHFEGQTAGVLALLRLLPQKTKIDELDRGLLAVVSREAGKPLFGGAANAKARLERKQ